MILASDQGRTISGLDVIGLRSTEHNKTVTVYMHNEHVTLQHDSNNKAKNFNNYVELLEHLNKKGW